MKDAADEIERLRGHLEKIADISSKVESKEMNEIWLVATEGLNSVFDLNHGGSS